MELKGGSRASVEGREDQFCCLILHRLWINVYFKTSFCLFLLLSKHWHSSCWFKTFVDRDLIYPASWTCYSCSGFPVLQQLGWGGCADGALTVDLTAAQTRRAAHPGHHPPPGTQNHSSSLLTHQVKVIWTHPIEQHFQWPMTTTPRHMFWGLDPGSTWVRVTL